uniref:Uncharacterized protein n=1 Tax=Zea mays TaxID=4577 RepID=A0A804PZ68_MAIZE
MRGAESPLSAHVQACRCRAIAFSSSSSSSSSSISLSQDAAPTLAPVTAGATPRQSKRTLPLAGVTEPSDAPPIFSRLVLAAAPPVVMDDASRSGALLDADQNGTRDDNVRVMNDGHRSDLPSRALRAPPRSRRPVRRRLSSPAAATISLRTSSGSRSVNRSTSPSRRVVAREWPVECDRGTSGAGRPDRDRTARRWLPIRSSSIASSRLLSSSPSSPAPSWLASIATWSCCRPSPVASPAGSSGSRLHRQTGHVTWPASHSPMQSGWKAWLQLGSSRSSSSSSNSLRQTAHSSAASLPPTRSSLASAYLIVGNDATTAGSSPRCWLRSSCRDRASSAAAGITGPAEAPRPHRRMYTEKKPMKKKAAMSATSSTTMGALKLGVWAGMPPPPPPPPLSLSRDGLCCAAAGASSSSSQRSVSTGSGGGDALWRGVVIWRWWVGGLRFLDEVAGTRASVHINGDW